LIHIFTKFKKQNAQHQKFKRLPFKEFIKYDISYLSVKPLSPKNAELYRKSKLGSGLVKKI